MASRIALRVIRPAHPDLWNPQIQPLHCVEVVEELDDVRSYWFEAQGGGHFRYLPGQHLTLVLEINGQTQYRVFTLSSTPTRPDRLCITVKTNRPDGITFWMSRQLKVGSTVSALAPNGRFSVLSQPVGKLLLISAGSGITPMLSTLRWLADRHEPREVVFIHAVSSPSMRLFDAELQAIDKQLPGLRVVQVVSRVPTGESWSGYVGRLDRRMLGSICPDLRGFDAFCCGPQGFMQRVQQLLQAEGFDMARYHQESFGNGVEAPMEADAQDTLNDDADRFTLVIDDLPLEVARGELLLKALHRQGVRIPTGCRNGLCGTCRIMLRSGVVEMKHQGGLSLKEEQTGLILACCSRARSDVVVTRLG
jgi:ferredoxin-NADP reductase